MGAEATIVDGPRSSWKRPSAFALGLILVMVACGGPHAPTSPSTGDTTANKSGSPRAAASPHPSPVDTIPTSWDEVAAIAHRVYEGRWLKKPAAGHTYCFEASRVVHGPGGLPAGELCLLHRTRILDGAGWAAPPTAKQAWVVTHMVAGKETILSAAGTKDALVEKVKCGALDRVWERMPRAHQRCTVDTDCQLLQSVCFEKPVATRSAAPYQQVLRKFGGTCIDPSGGMCPRTPRRAVCRSGVCAAGDPP